jgi:integrase
MVDQLRTGELSIERAVAMVANQEPLIAMASPSPVGTPGAHGAGSWPTVSDMRKRYIDWLRAHPNKADGTTRIAGHHLASFEAFEYEGRRVGDMALDTVRSALVMNYQQSMIDADRSPNSISTYVGRVATLFTFALQMETREAREQGRPIRDLLSPIIPELLYRKQRPRDRVLTDNEANSLLASTPDQLLWFIGCGLLAGLRIGETLHLRPDLDVDFELGTITIREQKDWAPKTARSRRLVPMAPQLLVIAKHHRQHYASERWMMPSPVTPGAPATDHGVRPHFLQIVERAGMVFGRDEPQGVTYHTLRHSFASHAVMNGVDLYTVSKLIGDSLKTVEEVYADLSPDFKREAMKKLAGAFDLSFIKELQPAIQENGQDEK